MGLMRIASIEEIQRLRRIGKYQVISDIGRGGMSAVYRARLVGPGEASKDVALKVIDPDLGDEESFLLMFLDEMRMAMSMTHRNIVQTFDAGQEDDLYYLVMELVDGCSLRDLLDGACGQPLPEHVALFVGMEVCAALAYAHDHAPARGQPRGIIHRDLSPGNILLSSQGDVKLADFGVAKAAGRRSETVIDAVKGKLAYMAPEQARSRATAASDLFSLGAVLYEMLSGRPFRQKITFDSVRDYAGVDLPLSELMPTLAPSLVALVHTCLAPNAQDRPKDARWLRRQLQHEHARSAAQEAEPDPHVRLQSYMRATLGARVVGGEAGSTSTSRPPGETANRLAEAMFQRVRQLPTDPAAGPSRAEPASPLLIQVITPQGRGEGGSTSGGDATVPFVEAKPRSFDGPETLWGKSRSLATVPRRRAPLVVAGVVLALAGGGLAGWLGFSKRLEEPLADAPARATALAPSPQADAGDDARATSPPPGDAGSETAPPDSYGDDGGRDGSNELRLARPPKRRRSRAEGLREPRRTSHVGERSRRRTVEKPGLLYLNTRPWTSVTIDGTYRGETPIEGLGLSPGTHQVVLVNRRLGITKVFDVVIEPGKTLRKALVLQ